MNRSFRQIKRSPFLRVLACFAWLMLVALLIHAESPGMTGGTHADGHATVNAMRKMASMTSSMTMAESVGHDHCTHAGPATAQVQAEDCCRGGDHGFTTCHCAATFGTALAAAGAIELLPIPPADAHPLPRAVSAPDMADGPPLRPPTV